MAEQDEIIAFLSNGASHGLASRAVERIDTHASSVFLVGDRAYKLKRAVKFSYLDYSTVARREAACRAEFEINHRIAPALYHAVRAIRRRGDGTLGFDGDGETLDWVLDMQRFDTAGLFDKLAEARRLTLPLMRELADVIAHFHADAKPDPSQGGSAGIVKVIAGNTENLRRFAAIFDEADIAGLDAASRAAVAANAALLERRRAGGKVRDCHGDLHLGNICLVDGKPTLFDAVEFSTEIAHIDVLFDLAFLLMDLLHRNLAGLANFVLNRYLDLTRDEGGLASLPRFLSVRAAIRAHVSAAAAGQQRSTGPRKAKEEAARSYLALARALLEPAEPRLVAIGGFSGSGKSTLALAIAGELPRPPGARVLRSDVLRKAMLDLAPEASLPASAYSHAMAKQVYAMLQHDTALILAAGYSVIMDATFLDPHERAAAELLAANAGIPFTGIWLEAKREIMVARLNARRGDASDATVAVLERQLETDPGPIAWRKIDSGSSQGRVAAALRRALGLRPN